MILQKPFPRPLHQQQIPSALANVILAHFFDLFGVEFNFLFTKQGVRHRLEQLWIKGLGLSCVSRYWASCQRSKIVLILVTKAGISKLLDGEAEPVDDSLDYIEVAEDLGLPVDECRELAEQLRDHGVPLASTSSHRSEASP